MAKQTHERVPKHIELQRRFEGLTDPCDMGTTGLAAWTLEGPGGQRRDWNRVQRASAVIHRRGLSVERFSRAVLADITNRWQRERFTRLFAAILRFYRAKEQNHGTEDNRADERASR
jgi:hypothetical protein